MLSNGFEVPLHLKLEPSKLLLSFQLFANLLAIVALSIPSAILFYLKIILTTLVIFNIFKLLHDYRRDPGKAKLWVWQKKAIWIECFDTDNRIWQCRQNNLVTPWFVVVTLYREGESYRLLIVKDQCDQDVFRRLSVRLRYFQGEAAIPTGAS